MVGLMREITILVGGPTIECSRHKLHTAHPCANHRAIVGKANTAVSLTQFAARTPPPTF
jgi:hypothetical protein